MKYLLALILVAINPWNDLDRIARINELKEEAQIAYTQGDYQKAVEKYKYLIDSMEVSDDNVLLNLANAYYQLNDTTNAVDHYQRLVDSENNVVRSVAWQQLGIVANRNKHFKQALEDFKAAIKANPANKDARYNYELLKKVLEERQQQQDQKKQQDNKQQQDKEQQQKKDQEQKQQQQQQQQNKEQQQQNKEQQQQQQQQQKEGEGKEQEKKDKNRKDGEKKPDKEKKKQEAQDGEESDKKNSDKQDQMSSISDKLKEMKISEEKAKMILQALRNKEIQYYQQNRRKAKEPNDPDKPDW